MFDFRHLFDHAESLEDLKRRYYRACMTHHPDRGGSEDAMKALNAAYQAAFDRLTWGNAGAREERDRTEEAPAWVIDRLRGIIACEGLEIEICGSWIWVGGDTRPHKEALKAAGFRWAPKKRMWYAKPANDHKRRKRSLSMAEIRERHGSTRVGTRAGQICHA